MKLRKVLQAVFECGSKEKRPICCREILEHQRQHHPRVRLGFTPSPIFGDPRAPIAFISLNPHLRPDDLTYDSLQTLSNKAATKKFIDYAVTKHRCIPEEEYLSKTSKRRISFLREVSGLLGLPQGMLSIQNGGLFTANVVSCPSEDWASIGGRKEIEQVCSKHLAGILECISAKIIFFTGAPTYLWLKHMCGSGILQVTGGQVNFRSDRVSDYNGKHLVFKLDRQTVYGIINSHSYIIKHDGLVNTLVMKGFLARSDYKYLRTT
jgi:hypothetical protein